MASAHTYVIAADVCSKPSAQSKYGWSITQMGRKRRASVKHEYDEHNNDSIERLNFNRSRKKTTRRKRVQRTCGVVSGADGAFGFRATSCESTFSHVANIFFIIYCSFARNSVSRVDIENVDFFFLLPRRARSIWNVFVSLTRAARTFGNNRFRFLLIRVETAARPSENEPFACLRFRRRDRSLNVFKGKRFLCVYGVIRSLNQTVLYGTLPYVFFVSLRLASTQLCGTTRDYRIKNYYEFISSFLHIYEHRGQSIKYQLNRSRPYP